jgi:hypothetical protein
LLEFIIFGLSVGASGYTAQKQEWGLFCIFVLLSLLFLALLKYLESAPVAQKLAALRRRENQLATRFDDWGIKDVFNMQDNQEMHRRNIANTEMIRNGQTFSLLAESGASYLDPSVRRHWDMLKGRLEADYHLRLLIVDPFCDAKALRNRRNAIDGPLDPKLKLEVLVGVIKRYPVIELRFTSEPYCSLFITEHELMYDPYHLGKRGDRIENYFLAFQVTRQGRPSVYDVLKNHFDFLWDQGQPAIAWFTRHKDELPPQVVHQFEAFL